jgi:hypothetical protein
MRNSTNKRRDTVRTLYAGAGLALTAGLLMGGAMKPQLSADGRPAGPQIFAGWAGARATGPFDDGASFASYSGQIPAYVIGTDTQKAEASMAAPPATPQAYAEESYYTSPIAEEAPAPEAARLTSAAYASRTAEHVAYPSLDGGAAYDDVSRAEKTPLVQTDDIGEEAPPEATGDTSIER